MYGNSPKTTKTEALKGVTGIKQSRCLDTRNTFEIEFETGDRQIRFHKTPIIWFQPPDGIVRLDSGGWRSRTTMERINQHQTLVRLFTHKNIWWIYAITDRWIYHPGVLKKELLPEYYSVFYDGIEIHPRNGILHPKYTTHILNRRVARIKKLCDDLKHSDKLPVPEMGDCMICMMEVNDRANGGALSKFKAMSEKSHIQKHVDEGYMHGHLLLNALLWNGYTQHAFFMKDTVTRSLRRFLKAHYELGY